jgi:hypothetical protein
MRQNIWCLLLISALLLCGLSSSAAAQSDVEGVSKDGLKSISACRKLLQVRPIAATRDQRFLGKVAESTALCRGGEHAVHYRDVPWLDWPNYWGTGDASTLTPGIFLSEGRTSPNGRGVDGALLDLEYERIELIKFNLFDNNGTYETYLTGQHNVDGPAVKTWKAMRLPADHPDYYAVGGGSDQQCSGRLIRHRTVTGICNDIGNPLMGSTGQLFARNVEFDTTFPRLAWNEMLQNRHGDRLSLLKPDPQLISRKLFTRQQTQPDKCNEGQGLPGDAKEANCDYKAAPFFNVLAAFWIQFMTHDWFSHLSEGHNQSAYMKLGCDDPSSGCRPGDRMEKTYVAQDGEPGTFQHGGKTFLKRAPKTFSNNVTAWWDASQIYGYDAISRRRVKRDANDPAKLAMETIDNRPGNGEKQGYLPLLQASDPMNPAWAGQAATAFPDNLTIGMSFYHNVFAREHNAFVDAFRHQAAAFPEADSGLRNPANPKAVITYQDVAADELFEAARLVVSAMIAKIHTIEWTTQLLYNEPLYLGMNANWGGLFGEDSRLGQLLARITTQNFGKSEEVKRATQWYSVFASGPGIFGLGSHIYENNSFFDLFHNNKKDVWDLAKPAHVNGGINHFGSPFNFPEEFTTVYRLHPLVPDLIDYREWQDDANIIRHRIPVVKTFRGKATAAMRERGLANWALSMGRQRLGLLVLQNHAQFLQNLTMPRLKSETKQIDVAALDLIRDRERGLPRFNEFRRQYGLRQLTSFDDFINQHLADKSNKTPAEQAELDDQRALVATMREIYGQHMCDNTKVITATQVDPDGKPITDCLGHPHGSMVDNVEDLDTVVGWLAETTRPHGFAISETQFVVFILNASRRLFSDRFFTSSFRPEFYTQFGVDWVTNNGPKAMMEQGKPNGHEQPVSPLKRVLMRVLPELKAELAPVINVFDPWARDRGEYYSLAWKPRAGAESDEAFKQ